MSDVLHLACGGDVAYLPHTAAMVCSVLEHAGELDVHVHYLHAPELPQRDSRGFAEMVKRRGAAATLVPVTPDRIAGLPGINHLTPAMWYRVFLPELLGDVGRVLYMDADALAVDSLAPLWNTDLGGAAIAAVTNVFEPWNTAYAESLGLRKPYFNSGVMVVDLERMRTGDATRRILDYAFQNLDRLPWGDQDPLNVVLGEERLELHPRWNCMNSVMVFEEAAGVFGAEAVAEARSRPGIRHFEGPSINKPWHLLCEWPGREDYFRFRAQTPWPHVRRDGVTPRNVLRRVARPLARRVRS
jgi:lipopolysaccharide biosynthesis glycosyltransferase